MANKKRGKRRRPPKTEPAETRAAEALTVAWTVSLTAVLLCNIVMILLHFTMGRRDAAPRLQLLNELLLFAGAVTGVLSLVLLPILYRVRRLPPPRGLAVFGACIAAAPILAVVMRALR